MIETLKCQTREKRTKGYLKQLIRQEMVPGIIYGKGQKPKMVILSFRELQKKMAAHGIRGLFTLGLEGEKSPVMALVREVQKEPISGKIVHIDFLRVSMTEKITSNVGIILEGEEELIKMGAILQVEVNEAEVNCLPADLPEYLNFDVSKLNVGDKAVLGDLTLPDGVELNSSEDILICSVLMPKRVETEAEEEGELTEEKQ